MTTSQQPDLHAIQASAEIIKPLHCQKRAPIPGDWLDAHRESGQTFDDWLEHDEFVFEPGRRNIVVQPIGCAYPSQRCSRAGRLLRENPRAAKIA